MKRATDKFNFPSDIKLNSAPLAEAWLEIQWQLKTDESTQMTRDPGYPFALGTFYESIKGEFGHRDILEASKAPVDMLPYVVRHRFRPAKGKWPLLQLGPGVASLNFTSSYTWDKFKKKGLFLRSKLSDAYGETELTTKRVILRYRNFEPFKYTSNDLLEFLDDNLNTSIKLPKHIPGPVGSTSKPTSANILLTFDLKKPKGTGTLRIATATRKQHDPESGQQQESEALLWQLEVASGDIDAPSISNEDEFANWLHDAHAVTHEWFFSFVDGDLREKYNGEGGS